MISKIVLIGLGLVLIAKSQTQAKARARVNQDLSNPTNWGADQWARLYGVDLSIDGNHPAPSGYDAYGMQNEMNWATPGIAPPGVNY